MSKTKARKISPRTRNTLVDKRAGLEVRIEPRGPSQRMLESVSSELLRIPALQSTLRSTNHRILHVELVDPDPTSKTNKVLRPPDRYRATFYDYTNQRTILVDGKVSKPKAIEVSESGLQPLPSPEEFEAALRILRDDPELGRGLRERLLEPYRPMPPLVSPESPDGRSERTITIGLRSKHSTFQHEIVGVNLVRQQVTRFQYRAPANSLAQPSNCGRPDAGQPTARKTAGQAWVTVRVGGSVIWKFLVVRPAASSGTNGSGIELRYVDYRGKRVLYRAHVPILNVQYDNNACGPYRDWQNEEGMLQADGADVLAGFRLCGAPATTILDTGNDAGNFLGVAIYVQGQEVVLVSEMEAGWYRYISQWRLHTDGTIRPRFGFSAVQSSCVCNRHHHHAYWRFDFDIRTPGNNIVREYNNPCLICPSNWHDKYFEIKRYRNPATNRKWRIENALTGEGYDIIPGASDGTALGDPFARGDVWVLRYHGSELDDGVYATGPPYEANIDSFINGESVYKQDVVVWYGAHFTHDVANEPPGVFGDIVGPDLKPVNW
jgi:copper amine oxidase-like protein